MGKIRKFIMLIIAQIIVSVIIIILVLLQERSSGLSGVLGGGSGGGTPYQTRRGMERLIFWGTVAAGTAFIILAIGNIVF